MNVAFAFLPIIWKEIIILRIDREEHNLDRCRTQFKLVADMEQKWDTMQTIVKKYQK